MSKKSATDYSKDILKMFENLAGKYSRVEIFNDWLEWQACSILVWGGQLLDDYYDMLVKMNIKYSVDELKCFDEISNLLFVGLDECEEDILGKVFVHMQPNKKLRQDFTPDCVCKLMDELSYAESIKEVIEKKGYCTVDEICCGSGGISIKKYKGMKSQGIDMDKVFFTACDIDNRCCQMTLIQFTFMGMKARIMHQDVLTLETYAVYDTLQLVYSNMTSYKKCKILFDIMDIEEKAKNKVMEKIT